MNKIRFKKNRISKQLEKVILSGLLVFVVIFSYFIFFQNNIISSTFSKLSTLGVLEFEDIPYGTYRAVEGDDRYFDFVSMLSIEDVPGVEFKQDFKGGLIIISPTGKDIIYGANIINKIKSPIMNSKTGRNVLFVF